MAHKSDHIHCSFCPNVAIEVVTVNLQRQGGYFDQFATTLNVCAGRIVRR